MRPSLLFLLAASLHLASAASAHAQAWAPALGLHAAAAVAGAFALHGLLPRAQRAPRAPLLFLFGALAFFVPILGTLGLAAALEAGLSPARRKIRAPASRVVDVPPLPARVPSARQSSGTDLPAPSSVLAHSTDPARRLRVVLAARRLPGGSATALLAAALRDPLDDLRLLSYALLERREQEIYARIETRLHALEAAVPSERAALHRLLAVDHWQLCHDGLVHGDLLQHTLEQARDHAAQALAIVGGDASLRVLTGRILLRLGRPAEARAELEQALSLGASRLSVLPWLAEAAFGERRFAAVRAALGAPELRLLGGSALLRARAFWR